MTSENRMRRAPRQARGQRRVAIILEAAAQVFAEIGYEAATTNAIAIRANTSIGSLYQFFPNKQSILNALANQHRAKLNMFLAELAKEERGSLQQQIDLLIERLAEYYTANPAFQLMFYASQSSPALTLVADELGKTLTRHVGAIFYDVVPSLASEKCDLYATIVVLMLRALIPVSQSQYEARRAQVLPQLKRMVLAYLASLEPFGEQHFTLDDE